MSPGLCYGCVADQFRDKGSRVDTEIPIIGTIAFGMQWPFFLTGPVGGAYRK